VERELGVSGLAGANPFEGPRSAPAGIEVGRAPL